MTCGRAGLRNDRGDSHFRVQECIRCRYSQSGLVLAGRAGGRSLRAGWPDLVWPGCCLLQPVEHGRITPGLPKQKRRLPIHVLVSAHGVSRRVVDAYFLSSRQVTRQQACHYRDHRNPDAASCPLGRPIPVRHQRGPLFSW